MQTLCGTGSSPWLCHLNWTHGQQQGQGAQGLVAAEAARARQQAVLLPLAAAREGLRLIQDREVIGKVVVTP